MSYKKPYYKIINDKNKFKAQNDGSTKEIAKLMLYIVRYQLRSIVSRNRIKDEKLL
jgi:hypothetical protein